MSLTVEVNAAPSKSETVAVHQTSDIDYVEAAARYHEEAEAIEDKSSTYYEAKKATADYLQEKANEITQRKLGSSATSGEVSVK